jgi:uncharacterized RDD family membrane protein YckC
VRPLIDTTHVVEAPEGVRLALRVAGPVPRAVAFALDAGLRWTGFAALAIALALLLGTGSELLGPLLFFLFFASEWFYPVVFEVAADGRTPGKRAVGIRVVHEDGTRVRWPASLLRNLIAAADWMPGTYAVGLVSMLTSERFRRLGDHAAGTLVVYAETAGARQPAPVETVEPLAPPLPLTLEEQQALLAFAERAPALTAARREELASLAAPLLEAGEAPSQRLLRIAAFVRGREERAA